MAGSSPDRQNTVSPHFSLLPQALLFCIFNSGVPLSGLYSLSLSKHPSVTLFPSVTIIMGAHSAVWQGMNHLYIRLLFHSANVSIFDATGYVDSRYISTHPQPLHAPQHTPITLSADFNGLQRAAMDRFINIVSTRAVC
jgi:hypothetical protein